MCMILPPPEPVYSKIKVLDKNGSSITEIDEDCLIVMGNKAFDIYTVLKMNPTTTNESPIFSYAGDPKDVYVECQNGRFDDIPATSAESNRASVIIPPTPDPHYDVVVVFFDKGKYIEHKNVELRDCGPYFTIYKGGIIEAQYCNYGRKKFSYEVE